MNQWAATALALIIPANSWAGPALAQLIEQAGPVEIRPATGSRPIPVAAATRVYLLSEIERLKSGPDAESARLFLANLETMGWPPGLFARLKEAGIRIAFYAPNARKEYESYAIYDFPSKTIYLWTNRPEVIAAELAHAISDLLEPDDPGACTGMMSLQDSQLFLLWAGYIAKVNRYLGVGREDSKPLLYPKEFAIYMLRREVSSPSYWLGNDPILGQAGYYSREAFWEEGVVWYFTRRRDFRSREPGLYDFVERKLREAENGGFRETAGSAPDMSRCFATPNAPGRLPSAY